MKQNSFYCPQCNQMRFFVQETPNYVAHLLVSLFLCGLWLPILVLIWVSAENNPYRCQMCGFGDRFKYLANPNLRTAELREAQLKAQNPTDVNLYKVGAICLGIFLVFAGIVFFVALNRNIDNVTNKQFSSNVETSDVQKRRDYALELMKVSSDKNLLVAAAGNNNEVLNIINPAIDQKYVDQIKKNNSTLINESKNKGFKKIVFNNKKKSWEINL